MSLRVSYLKYTLNFTFEAGTSRGTLTQKDSYFLRLSDSDQPDVVGYGECGPLRGLSLDDIPDFEDRLSEYCQYFNQLDLQLFDWNVTVILNQLISQQHPSILFGFETAMHDFLSGGHRLIRESEFVHGRRAIPINGLVWMGSHEAMRKQIDQKIAAGYTTIKLKIGAIDFEQECALLAYIREQYSPEQITLRVDANGAFHPDEALVKLERLAQYHLHSIEQPIAAGQHDLIAALCSQTPLPIALDEELIGHMEYVDKFRLLKKIQPQYIILKPTLLGGMRHCDEWIELANRLSIGWWITSALESNIGLNAIAQYASQFKNLMPQGLGTGQLYHNNISSPLHIEAGTLRYNPATPWHLNGLRP